MKSIQDALAYLTLRFALFVTGHPGERIKPRALPNVEAAEANSWREGWWAGIAVGFVNGAGVVALLFSSGVL